MPLAANNPEVSGHFAATQAPKRPEIAPDPDNGGIHLGAQIDGVVTRTLEYVPSHRGRLQSALGAFQEAPPDQLRHRLGLIVDALVACLVDEQGRASRRGLPSADPTQRSVCGEVLALIAKARPGAGPLLVRLILEHSEDLTPTRRALEILEDYRNRSRPDSLAILLRGLAVETNDPFVATLGPMVPQSADQAAYRTRERLARLDRLSATRAKARDHVRTHAPAIVEAAGGKGKLTASIAVARRLTGVVEVDPRATQADTLDVELAGVRRDLEAIRDLDVPTNVLADLKARESDLAARIADLRKAAKTDGEASILSTVEGLLAGDLGAYRTLLTDLLAIPGAFAEEVRAAVADADPLPRFGWAAIADAAESEGLRHCPRE